MRPDPDATVPGEAPRFAGVAVPVEIPGFEIRGEIHRGGQGVVWRALQRSTRREVALKTLLSGSFASERERFLFEREVATVASLRHPNLVTLFESGVAPGGELWFAMELVEGRTLAEAAPASYRERVRMLAKVARAVAHAHGRGVIHRDLKPGNILLTEGHEPKVLDFGLARPVGDASGEKAGEFVGTARYAAPEQIRGEHESIDVRTDVFALGLMLYELLADASPFPAVSTRDELLDAMARRPDRPSVRNAAARRELGPLADDLDAVSLACLSLDSVDRYQSAGELADELERCLGGFPVRARGDAFGYVVAKFVRRHRLATATAAGVFLLVIASAASLAVLWARAERNRERAERTLATFRDTLLSADPEIGRGARDLTVLEYFDSVADAAAGDPAADPLVASTVLNTVEGIHLSFDDRDRSRERLDRALEFARRAGPAAVAEALHNLGRFELLNGRLAEARGRYEEAFELRERIHGPLDPRTAMTLQHLASTLRRLGELDAAEDRYARLLEVQEGMHGPESDEFAAAINGRAWVRRERGDRTAALADFERAKRIIEVRHGPDDYRTARTLSQIAALKLEEGRPTEAVADYRRALSTIVERKGARASTAIETRLALAEALAAAGQRLDAIAEAERALADAREGGDPALATDAERLLGRISSAGVGPG